MDETLYLRQGAKARTIFRRQNVQFEDIIGANDDTIGLAFATRTVDYRCKYTWFLFAGVVWF